MSTLSFCRFMYNIQYIAFFVNTSQIRSNYAVFDIAILLNNCNRFLYFRRLLCTTFIVNCLVMQKGTPRPSRGFCLCGHSPCLLAALKERIYDLSLAKGCPTSQDNRFLLYHSLVNHSDYSLIHPSYLRYMKCYGILSLSITLD